MQVMACENDVTPSDVFMGVLPFFHAFAIIVVMNLAIYTGAKVISMARFDLQQVSRH